MKKGNSKFLIIIIVLIVAAAIMLYIKKSGSSENTVSENTEKRINVNVTNPEKGNIGKAIFFNGEVRAQKEFILNSRLSEKILGFYVENGQKVKTGDVIVKLEPVNYTQQFRRAEASLESARTNFEISERDFERNKMLYEKKVINDKSFDSVRNSFQKAKESLIQAEAQYEISKRDFESLEIVAPFDGIFVDRNGEQGQLISPGFVFGRIIDTDKVNVETFISGELVNDVKIGSKAEIESRFGEVVSINMAADKISRNFLVKMLFDNKDNNFVEGAFVQGNLYSEYFEDILLFPNRALLYDDHGYYIFVNKDEKAHMLRVNVLAKNRDWIFADNIDEKTEIIVSGQSIVKDGSLLYISEE